MKNTTNQKTIKFEDIQNEANAELYAKEWSLPKVPFVRMHKYNCQDEEKCVKLTLALQSLFNGAKENAPFKIIDLAQLPNDEYLVETSVGNFELKFNNEIRKASVEKTEKKIVKEKVVKIEPQEVVDASAQQKVVEKTEKVEPQQVVENKKGFSLRLFGKEILGWN